MKGCPCTANNSNSVKKDNASASTSISEKHVQFLRTSFIHKVLASFKILQSSKKCRGLLFGDIVKFVVSSRYLTGDIESQVQNAISNAVCSNFLVKKGDRYFLVPQAASIQDSLQETKKQELSRIDTVFNFCKRVQLPHSSNRCSRPRTRTTCRSRSRTRSRSRSRSRSPRPCRSTKRCPPRTRSSLENLKNKILAKRRRKMKRKRECSKYSLRSLSRKEPVTNLCKVETSCPRTSRCDKKTAPDDCANIDNEANCDSCSSTSSSSCCV